MAVQNPHTGCRREPKRTAAGNKLHYLGGDLDCLEAGWGLRMSVLYIGAGTLNTGFCLGLAEEKSFETGVHHSPRPCSTWIKPISFFKKIILLLFNYSCLHFLPTPDKPTFFLCFHPPPWLCPCVLYSSSCKPFSPLSPPCSPLAIVRLFLTSMSLVIFCLLFSSVDYIPVKGVIIWYVPHCLAYVT